MRNFIVQKRLTAISFGMEFGFVDPNEPSDFLACEFLEVINKETGKIKFLFSGKEFEEYVLNLYIKN